ncbi:hypothetical protein ZOSMA_2G02360 [Zostera marina]|uniref:Transmembrane protein n=1 Tax=Zostera marina TaxID=29655 RepID=A0A0K9PB99_ZOSMR|nr:hypothetical protein ZOSMA_2G02360 [Zostera marina]
MGTREVYEEKLRSGNLFHEPTLNPGLGSPRCPRCFSFVNPTPSGEWAITPVLHDATKVAGAGVGGMLGAVHGFNRGLPFIKKHVKGSMLIHLLVGLPPLLLFSGAAALFGGYTVPKLSQLSVTSYYASSSASYYTISQATSYIEDNYSSQQEKPK